ncbi:MAG TPA: dihydroorotase [candidate division Zixibacteria bacterium]|nr:dihydroorotase [candidate division Zixibacteria bacterium]
MEEKKGIVIKNGRVIDPVNGVDKIADVYIVDELIERIGGRKNYQGFEEIDAEGKFVLPGLVDLHVHLREPGGEDAETIETGALAAVRGGFTSICCMPNTSPPVDTASDVRFIYDRASYAPCRVYPVAAISKGLKGVELSEMGDLTLSGAVAFSDDGKPVENPQLLRNALTYSSMLGVKLALHCEDLLLANNGNMHEGEVSGRSGMPASPGIAETAMIARDIMIAEYLDSPVHFCHVSAKESVQVIREAKGRGAKVTAETTPHHLLLTDEEIPKSGFDALFKVNPPLRSAEDVAILREAIIDGTIDAIATDHAPHPTHEKDRDFITAPFGIIGLETALGLIHTHFVKDGLMSIGKMVELMSTNPASIFDLPAGTLAQGSYADITIFDPNLEWTVDKSKFASISKNTVFDGWKLTGKAVMTIVDGEIVFNEME